MIIYCPKCGAAHEIEPDGTAPTLVVKGEVFLPTLVAVKCQVCKHEIRLDGLAYNLPRL